MSVRQGNGSGGATISGDVTVVQPTGTQLHVVVDTAPTTAVTNAGLTELAAAINASSQMDVNIAASGATVPVSLTSTTITGTIAVTQSGTWDEVGINDSGNSITVDNAALSVVGGGVELTALRVTLASDSTGVLSVDDNGGALTVDGTVTANLAAGTNNIGDVDVLTLPSLVAGTALIGKVSIDQVTANANEVVIKSITAGDTNIGNVDIASIAAGDNNIGNVDIVSGTITTVSTVTNLSQLGGAAVPIGAGVEATAVRVTLPTDCTGVLTVKQATAANLNVTEASASAIKTAVELIDNAISGSEMQVDVVAALPAGTNAIGKLAANSGVDIGDVDVTSTVTPVPTTSGGCLVANFNSGDTYTALTNTAQVIKASAGQLYGYYIYNPNATAAYVLLYNIAAASVTVGTSTAQMVFCIPATAGANLDLTHGIPFTNAGWSIAATTTGGGNTAPTTALEAMIFYK